MKYANFIGYTLQQKIFSEMFRIDGYAMSMYVIFIVFSLISIIIAFYAYREFKGMLFDSAGMMGGQVPMMPGTSSY